MKLILAILFISLGTSIYAQSTFDKLLFEEAQEAYANKNYELSLTKLEELEQRNAKGLVILNLRIKARFAIVQSHEKRLEYLPGQFKTLSKLHQDIDYYLNNYDNPDFSRQYKEVYDISKATNHYPKTTNEWENYLQQIQNEDKAKKQRIIDAFVKSMIKIEKGYYYAGIPFYWARWRGSLKATESAENNLRHFYVEKNVLPRKVEIDYDFSVSNGFVTEELIWALFDHNFYINRENKAPNKSRAYIRDEQFLQTIITLLNTKTGLKFRLITAEENDYLMRGGSKNAEMLYSFVDKKIIGGNKRKGYQYETKEYYAYNYRKGENDNFDDHKLPFGGLVSSQPYEMYKSFSGKASTISYRPVMVFMPMKPNYNKLIEEYDNWTDSPAFVWPNGYGIGAVLLVLDGH